MTKRQETSLFWSTLPMWLPALLIDIVFNISGYWRNQSSTKSEEVDNG